MPASRLHVLIAILLAAPAASQTILESAGLQNDIAILRQAFETLHPGLYRYNSKDQTGRHFAQLSADLNHNQTRASVFLAFSRFAATLRCGHTYCNLLNQPKATAAQLLDNSLRLPFDFEWIDGTPAVTEDRTIGASLPRGTVVLAINGTPASTILDKLLTIARADGSNDAKRINLLGVAGPDPYQPLNIFFPLFFPVESPDLHLLIRRPGSNAQVTVDVRSTPRAAVSAKPEPSSPLFDWTNLPDGTSLLRMPTWAVYNSKWDWHAWLDSRLDDLAARRAPALIVDLRRNEGGQDIGNVILAHLIDRDLHLDTYQRLVRYRQVPANLIPYLDTWDPSFKDWGAAALTLASPWPTAPDVPYLRLVRFDDDSYGDVIRPAGNRFTGRVFVLVDEANSSATFQFAEIIQRNHLGTLVGRPTGGNQRGINGGAFFFLRLPYSKIEIDLPLIGTFPRDPRPDAGLTPDLLVPRTIAGIAAHRDADLEAVRDRLARCGMLELPCEPRRSSKKN